ncbi:MAG: isoprenylcysteine carboxylmethyltransferase family protein [bacterium]
MCSKPVLEWFARYRIFISKIFGVSLIIIFLFSENIWAQKPYAGWLALTLQSLGLIFVTICVLGRLWSAVYLCGNKTFTLVTKGPYSVVRNPLYFFSFLGVIGIALTAGSFTGLLLIIFMFMFNYLPTILDEEKTLERFHTDNLAEYMAKVPRLIPNFSLLDEPEVYEIKPHAFRKTFFDVAWFFWVYLILEIIQGLHSFNVLPVFFKII